MKRGLKEGKTSRLSGALSSGVLACVLSAIRLTWVFGDSGSMSLCSCFPLFTVYLHCGTPGHSLLFLVVSVERICSQQIAKPAHLVRRSNTQGNHPLPEVGVVGWSELDGTTYPGHLQGLCGTGGLSLTVLHSPSLLSPDGTYSGVTRRS